MNSSFSPVVVAGCAFLLAAAGFATYSVLKTGAPAPARAVPAALLAGPEESRDQAALAPTPAPAAPAETGAMPGAHSAAPSAPGTTHAAYVAQRVAVLQELSMDDQDSSLRTILSELTNRDPQIREAARDAAVQFASRDAIPDLLQAAAQTEDPEEKKELIEAAEFLKLPSLTEVMAQRGITPTIRPLPAPGKQLPAFDRRPPSAPAAAR